MSNIAILTYGQPRFIGQSESLDSHRKFLMDKYNYKVLSHHWFPKPDEACEVSTWSQNTDNPIPDGAISKLTRLYNPTRYFIESQKSFEFSPELREIIQKRHNPSIWKDSNLSNVISHLTSIQKVFKLLSDYITDTGEEFDFVALVRTDLVILDMPHLDDLDPYKFYISNHHDAFPDLFMIMGAKFIESWGVRLADSMEEVYQSMLLKEPSAEAFKGGCFYKYCQASDLRSIHLPCQLVTKRGGAIYVG